MSRRARARREAIESKYVAMHSEDDHDDAEWEDADWEDADFDSLAVYREAESTESEVAKVVDSEVVPRAGIEPAPLAVPDFEYEHRNQ